MKLSGIFWKKKIINPLIPMLKLVDFLWCSMKMRNINKLLLTKVCEQNLDILLMHCQNLGISEEKIQYYSMCSVFILHGPGKKFTANGYILPIRYIKCNVA